MNKIRNNAKNIFWVIIMKLRVKACFVFILLSLSALCVRLVYINVADGKRYMSDAENQQTVTKKIEVFRGNIYDRNMISFTKRENSLLGIRKDGSVGLKSTAKPSAFIFPRRYGADFCACHVLGYLSADGHGMSAIEKKYDYILGSDEFYTVKYRTDGLGRPVGSVETFSDISGSERGVKLTLDYHIQKAAENTLRKYIKKGAAVILDTDTFDVLAMVSVPMYNQNDISRYSNSKNGELVNRALCAYNAGSVFKIVTTAAALEMNPYYKDVKFYCSGSHVGNGGRVFMCNNPNGHGVLSLPEAFAKSCNCAFYETGLCSGGKSLYDMAVRFGISDKLLNPDIGQATGVVPYRDFYSEYETINLSIGQGEILITPLQCAVLAATVANGGERMDVNLVSETSAPYFGVRNEKRKNSYRVIDGNTAYEIASMMRLAVTDGTASKSGFEDFGVAGKTGSAETGWTNESGEPMVHGWFCGFFPYDKPKYAMAVFCEDGKSGAESCVKPFMKICEEIEKIYPFKQ